jgi:small subunit ribosomal protein S9
MIVVNGRAIDEYFGRETLRSLVKQPLDAANATTRYDIAASGRADRPAGRRAVARHRPRTLRTRRRTRPTLKKVGF